MTTLHDPLEIGEAIFWRVVQDVEPQVRSVIEDTGWSAEEISEAKKCFHVEPPHVFPQTIEIESCPDPAHYALMFEKVMDRVRSLLVDSPNSARDIEMMRLGAMLQQCVEGVEAPDARAAIDRQRQGRAGLRKRGQQGPLKRVIRAVMSAGADSVDDVLAALTDDCFLEVIDEVDESSRTVYYVPGPGREPKAATEKRIRNLMSEIRNGR
ncbi:hypothetical protein [Sediminicurvatus halobius]|uniref:Uncharacterized protein n=1 Tax=Sediminicurvatus halobius TaxID=2182432 RepID=A0A2U2N042_9GAMM|nr:hypothetical protein [Spiribacter halobius]PWG62334.1 hypothetical protein DEM34_12735 [Spiribacter halobius]UEX79743.1 hypothetical protein LMH63_08885 [Spiribacter halobius]